MTKTGRVRAVALLAAVGLLPLGCSDSSTASIAAETLR